MIQNFKEYWEERKDLLEKLGVTREVASMIWSDAVNCTGMALLLVEIKKNHK